ncbi:MAG: GAF and ANTAR domain-containing protein [Mycolicibacterium sp.]|nr:GAF and ANTAR domain-containing protein [Mycolicibacterium sp.]
MTEPSREIEVLAAVVTLVDSLLDDFDVVDLLTGLTERCSELLDVTAAGVLLADPMGRLRLVAATSEAARELELFQLQAEQGPCVDCYRSGQPVSVEDLASTGDRWPRFTAVALEAGFASVHAIPMRAAGMVLGALGFGDRSGRLNDADLLVARTLAHVACVAVLQERAPTPATVGPPLQAALNRRIVVEQAKGFLRETLNVSVEEAFTLLRDYAREHGQHLSDVAETLMIHRDGRPVLVSALAAMKPR